MEGLLFLYHVYSMYFLFVNVFPVIRNVHSNQYSKKARQNSCHASGISMPCHKLYMTYF